MSLVRSFWWRKIFPAIFYANTARGYCLSSGVVWNPSKSIPGHTSAPAANSAAFARFNILPIQISNLLLFAEIVVISLLIAGILTLALRRAQTLRKVDEFNAKRVQSNSVLALKVAVVAGTLRFLFDSLNMALHPAIAIWASHLLATLFTALIALVVTLIVLSREDRLRRALSQNEERYKLLFEKSLTGAYRMTLDGLILDCNVSFCQLFGYATREEVIGRTIDFAYASPDGRAQFAEKLQAEKNLTNFRAALATKRRQFTLGSQQRISGIGKGRSRI